MNPILDLLNRLFLANPSLALEEVKHLLIQKERDIDYWRDKHARADQDLNAAQYEAEGWKTSAQTFELERDMEFLASKNLREAYAKLLDQKHALEQNNESLSRIAAERFNRINVLEEQVRLNEMRILRSEARIADRDKEIADLIRKLHIQDE